jgi:hypothetical protein
VERHIVIKLVAGELLEARGMLRGDVVAQLHDDAALRGVDDKRVLRIGAGGQLLRGRGGDKGSGKADEQCRNDDRT